MASRKVPEINAGSMADISFLLLIFFLVTTTMDVDSGLQRRLPPMPTDNQSNPEINQRNIIVVRINSSDRLFAGGGPIDISQLKDQIIEFITNPTDDPKKPVKEVVDIEGFGPYPVSKAVISLQNDRGTSYKSYIQVQNELVKAINEVRDNFAMANFGKKMINLTEEQQEIVRKAIPSNISEAEPIDISKR